jgi:phosphatidylserine/phosphatidylglycerophosphate/cardiolipin synthase-like enzyme
VIVPGDTVWRTADAERLGFIIDARDYFAAFVDAVERARESVMILAWDVDSRLRLIRDRGDDGIELAAMLAEVLERRPELHIHVLCWDFSTIYAMERELLSQFRMDWMVHDRLHFSYDSNYPPMGSLHEKLVVVDDRVAFIGGIDLGPRRWDTSDHAPNDERRVSPAGTAYRPFHDVQAVVQGDVARVLGDFARRRWRRATGDRLDAPRSNDDPWPTGVEAAVEDLEVALVRTRPEHDGRDAMSHTLRFHERLFELAEDRIYVENQFLTSEAIADALAGALERDTSPETLLVTARENSGWLETAVMGGLRTTFCRRLHEADHRGRLRICSPRIDRDVWPNVHSKLTIVDDCWAYLGSANFANRSMGLDTECGLGLDGTEREDLRAALRGLRHRLLAEHLDVEPDAYRAKESELGMLGAVDALRVGVRTLEDLEVEGEGVSAMLEPVARLADPDRPPRLTDLFNEFL